MTHLSNNIKIIRALCRKTQTQFAAIFEGVTEAMQKSYESGKANPGVLYMETLAQLSGVPVRALTDRALNRNSFSINHDMLSVEKVESTPIEKAGGLTFLGAGASFNLDEYIADLKNDKAHLQETIRVNLTAMMQLLTALSQHDRAYHDVILKSLARLEKRKDENSLIEEGRIAEAAKVVEVLNKGKRADTHM